MTDKEYEEKRMKLNEYRDTISLLARRNEEAQHWDSMCLQTNGGILGHRAVGNLDSIITTTLSLLDECNEICAQASVQREKLCSCISCVQLTKYRDVLESVYLNGKTVEQIAESNAVSTRTILRWLRSATAMLSECSNFFNNCHRLS